MANYYHEARAQVKKLKTISDDKRRKSERAAELATIEAENPLHALRIDGRAVKLRRNQDAYAAAETLASMIPWNGDTEKMIDRFDGRALLDFYKEPDPRTQYRQTEAEQELEELVNFEAFRDLVKMLQLGISEETAILLAEDENLDMRASAKSTAVGQFNLQSGQSSGPQPQAAAAGIGQYGAVGFSYGGPPEAGGESGSASEESEEEEEDEESGGEENEQHADLDGLAANLGISSFSTLLRRAEREEEQIARGIFPKKKRRFSRKVAAQRARRMAGQGLGPLVNKAPEIKAPGAIAHRDYGLPRRGSPSYDPYRRRSTSRSSSRSRSPPRRKGDSAKTEFITEFKASKARSSSHVPSELSAPKRAGPFVDVLPEGVDPAGAGGPVSLPKEAVTMQGVRAHSAYYSYEDERRKERERERERDRDREKAKLAAAKAAQPAQAVDKGKETPMERLKRLRAAQINKAFQQEALTVAQRRLQEEKDRRARETIERAAAAARRSPSPPSPHRHSYRNRDRSRSPRRRRHSRSRSPGRRY
ncbi:g8099 [Coccomyxa elongata]